MIRWSHGLVALLWMGCAKHVPPTMTPAEVLTYETGDGWTHQLRHYPASGPPVLLVHGMGANHYNWDYRPEVSLADYLQSQGWDVWIPTVRGDRDVEGPDAFSNDTSTFDDHAVWDIPAAIERVLEITGEEKLFWVGHSMGGMLLYTTLSTKPETIVAGVGVGSPAQLTDLNPVHRWARRLGWFVPAEGMMPNLLYYRVTRSFGRANPLSIYLTERSNMEWSTIDSLGQIGLRDMPRPTVRQVHTWLHSGEFLDLAGQSWMSPSDVPVLVLAGTRDHVAPPVDVEATCAYYRNCSYLLIGRETGYADDYGHVDLILGRNVRTETYPLIHLFLEEHLPGGVVLVPRGEAEEVGAR